MREWAVPIGLGILVGGLVALLPEPAVQTRDTSTVEGVDGIVFPFETGPLMDDPRGSVLVISDGRHPAQINWTPGESHGVTAIGYPTWHGDIGQVDIDEYTFACVTEPCSDPKAPWVMQGAEPGPRFGVDNHTAVRLALYVFTQEAELVTSTAPAYLVDRFDLYGDYFPLSNVWWYLGNGSLPDGMYDLPFGRAMAAEALAGLPVGGIATIHLTSHPYDWLVGEVWLTGKVVDLRSV